MKPSSAMAFVSAIPGRFISVFSAREMASFVVEQPAKKLMAIALHRTLQQSMRFGLFICNSSWFSCVVVVTTWSNNCRFLTESIRSGFIQDFIQIIFFPTSSISVGVSLQQMFPSKVLSVLQQASHASRSFWSSSIVAYNFLIQVFTSPNLRPIRKIL